MAKPVIALIGAGQMGASHARVIAESNDAALGLVIDQNATAAEKLASQYWARASTDIEAAMGADAVVIAAATASHFACAMPLLEAGKPVLVEKPFAPTLGEVDLMLAAAEKSGSPVMCGFVERFNAAFRTAAAQVASPPTHVMSVRHSPPAPRIASSVVADMLLHDLDVMVRLFGTDDATLVGAACRRPDGMAFLEVADCLLRFPSGMANCSVNRLGQRKVRSITIHADEQLVEVDLLRQAVTVYRNVSQEMMLQDGVVGYRSSTEIDLPFVRHSGEPLALQFAHFLQFVDGRGDAAAERTAIRPAHVLMEAVEQSAQPQ
jgi:predicted dehydrogenase